jgi:hypothetical protein
LSQIEDEDGRVAKEGPPLPFETLASKSVNVLHDVFVLPGRFELEPGAQLEQGWCWSHSRENEPEDPLGAGQVQLHPKVVQAEASQIQRRV